MSPPPRSGASPLADTRRYLALWFPHLSTDRIRGRLTPSGRPDERPLVVVERHGGALRLAALDAKAIGLGLSAGMALAEARALVPALDTADAAPEADAGLLRACAEACEMFTPLVALRGADGLVLDITGCAHLFGDEAALARLARRRIGGFGLSSRAAIATTPDAAFAFARHGGITGANAGVAIPEAGAAKMLPIAALGCDSATALALRRAGLRSLGDLAARPPHVLAARFGKGLVSALQRILGLEDIRITPLRPPPLMMSERHFSEPMTAMESLLAVLQELAQDIAHELEARGEGGRAFGISFFRADGAVRRIALATAQGMRDAAGLMRLVRLKIEALADPLDPGFGFDALRMAVLRSEPLAALQSTLAGREEAQDESRVLADLVNRLVARFGDGNVRRFVALDTHDPVLAGRAAPYLAGVASAPWSDPEEGEPPARPLTLFAPPQPIEVLAEVPDSPPLRFRWRRVLHHVALAEGPERIAPEWWRKAVSQGDAAPAPRDYYRVEDMKGHRFWIFREGYYEDGAAHPRWFIHGLFT
jgi:protein ImuB